MTLFLTLQGFSYVDYYNGGYENADSLASLVKTRASSIETAFEYGINPQNDTVYADSNYTDSLTAIGSTIKEAVGDGLSVMVRPLIDFLNPTYLTGTPYSVGDWRTYFNPGAAGSAGANAFFASYKTMLLQYAQVGAANGASSLCIGTELDQITGPAYKSYWDDIISTLRSQYPTLKLTYAADWDDALSPWQYGGSGLKAGTGNLATQVSFASELDYFGVDEYAAISDAANPTLAQLIAGWTKTPTDATTHAVTGDRSLISYFESVAAAVGKPLIFTEIGYESATDAASSPAGSATNKSDPALQSLLYQAFFEAWQQAGDASLTGVYFWNWDPNAAEVGPGNGANFSPQGEPAQTVITQAFSSSSELQLAQYFGAGSTLEIDLTSAGSVVTVFDNVSGGETVIDIPGYQISDAQIVTGGTAAPYVLNLSAGVIGRALTISAGDVLNGPGELLGANAIFGRENGVAVGSGGSETIHGGGLATGATVLAGGREVVSSGGSSVSARVSGGVLQVSGGGTASNAVVRGGAETILAQATATGTMLSGGYEYDYGTTSGTVISSGGHEQVAYGAVASGSVVSSGGREGVLAGGWAAGAIVSGGGLYVSSGGHITRGLTIEGGVADISGTVATGQTVGFTGASGVLGLYNLTDFHAHISGMSGAGQKIELGGFAYSSAETASWVQSNTSGKLTLSDGVKTAQLTLVGTYVSSDFHLARDGHGGTYVDVSGSAAGFAQAMAGFSGRREALAAIYAGGSALVSAPHPITVGSSSR